MQEHLTKNNSAENNNLEILKQNFPHCFDKIWNFDFDKFKKEISKNEINFSKESYAMDWLGKSYARVLASDSATTLLKEDKDWNKKEENKNSENVLIKWDNLEVLKHLSNAYYEKVKMIYIDPPYNTGSDGFVYQDDRKFSVKEFSKLAWVDMEKSKRILDFVDSKSNSHSAWLTFMYPRLYIAKQLLKDDWVIFISIDDNEVSQLKILMDEIFGEENFIASIIWHKKYGASNDSRYFSEVHDYVLLYANNKDSWNPNLFERPEELNAKYKNHDNDSRWEWIATNLSVKTYSKSNDYIIIWPNDDKFSPPPTRAWSVSESKYNELLKDNRITFWVNWKSRPYLKTFLSEVQNWIVPNTMWNYNDAWHNVWAKSELRDLFKGSTVPFDTPKPTKLIKRIIKVSEDKNDIILDFFWWSWTTWDAVMQLNSDDWGDRKYIIVQIPEKIDKKKSKVAYDFVKDELWVEEPTIFDITKERLVRAGNKIKKDVVESWDEKKIEKIKKLDFWFKVFETSPIWEDYNVESEVFSENLKLFDETKMSSDDLATLLTTWKTADNIKLTQDLENVDLDWYIAHYFEDKLYLMNKDFEIKNLKELLEKIDLDKTFEPKTIIAFGYNFESKNLREIAENIKAYSNKKNIDIDFITRY